MYQYSTQQPEIRYFAPMRIMRKRRSVTRAILIAWSFAFIFSLIVLGSISVNAPAAATKNTPAVTDNPADAFYAVKVNELRAQKKLPPVKLLLELDKSSSTKANYMAANHYWGHYDPDGYAFSDYIWKQVPIAQLVGENLARCYPNREQAFAALVASPTHYEIMVGNFNYMGVSEAYDSTIGCTITVMHFASI